MKRTNAIPWWGWLTWGLVVALGLIAYTHLPPLVAGEHHRLTPRLLVVLYEPALMLVIMLLWQVLWRIDPKRRNYEVFWPTYRYIGGVIVVGMGLVYATIVGHVLHLATIRFAPTAYGIMFMLIANVLPRLRPNWWVGIRTPWTLSSEASWNRTHRLAGQLGIPIGTVIIILAWVLPTHRAMILAIVGPIILWVLITVVASYFFAQVSDRHP